MESLGRRLYMMLWITSAGRLASRLAGPVAVLGPQSMAKNINRVDLVSGTAGSWYSYGDMVI
jgi:hypothetical protein